MPWWLMSPGSQQGAGFVHTVTDHIQGQEQDGQTDALDLQGHMEDTALFLRPAGLCQLLGDVLASL